MDVYHNKIPAAVNSPGNTIAWLNYIADFDDFTEEQKKSLIISQQDFASMQQTQGTQGGERPNQGQPKQSGNLTHQALQGTGQVPPLVAQSQSTPFHNPAALAK
jgi:hypothetical protein